MFAGAAAGTRRDRDIARADRQLLFLNAAYHPWKLLSSTSFPTIVLRKTGLIRENGARLLLAPIPKLYWYLSQGSICKVGLASRSTCTFAFSLSPQPHAAPCDQLEACSTGNGSSFTQDSRSAANGPRQESGDYTARLRVIMGLASPLTNVWRRRHVHLYGTGMMAVPFYAQRLIVRLASIHH